MKEKSFEEKLRDSAKRHEGCEGCCFFTYPTAVIVVNGKRLKTCNQNTIPEICDFRPQK